ncbi:MAG TPA: hypothetical protein VG797_08540, partial [Phycisphaerales bacterium]|nr:hypothetical protein [Phycisphaerales bacterium]
WSYASNLVPGDTNGFGDVFVRDRQTGNTSRVSVGSAGEQGNDETGYFNSISVDGRFVAFDSNASNFVPGDTNGFTDVFVHDRQTGQTSRVSVGIAGIQGNDASDLPSLSADGRFVSFWSFASNLVPGDTNGFADLFVHDRQTGQTSRVNVNSAGEQANADAGFNSISADGRFVAFESDASNLVPDDTNGYADVFVHDRQTGQTARVSVASGGAQGKGGSRSPSISGDGRYVAFRSYDSDLVPGDTNFYEDVFVHDRVSGQTTRVSVASDGTEGSYASGGLAIAGGCPAISADGRVVAFISDAPNLVPGDTNKLPDVFVHDRHTARTTRVSVDSAGGQANEFSAYFPVVISADGRSVAFDSLASNLVPGDTNNTFDVFVHDRGATTPACPGDVDGSNGIGLSDIAVLIQNWTFAVPPAPAAADLDGNGSIGLGDVAAVILHWAETCQ